MSINLKAICRKLVLMGCVCIPATLSANPLAKTVERNENSLQFIENKGQWVKDIKYKANLNGGVLFLTDAGFVYDYYNKDQYDEAAHRQHDGLPAAEQKIDHHAFKVIFKNANNNVACIPSSKLPFYHNYFMGRDAAKWAGKVGVYGQVYMRNVYDGIDLSVYGKGPDLKYDFKVKPGADPALIQLVYEGAKPVLTREGHLLIRTSVNEVKELAPFTFQWVNGRQKRIASGYQLEGNTVSFRILDNYDKSLPLIIDPQLEYSTYSGAATGSFACMSTTYDANGSLFAIVGTGDPNGWPTTMGAYQTTPPVNGFISNAINKYSADGTTLIYSTFIGGPGVVMSTNSSVTTAQNELIITGTVLGGNYPVTAGAYDVTYNQNVDLFVTRFSADGAAILQSTFVGGNNVEAGMIDINGGTVLYLSQNGASVGNYSINKVDIQLDNAGNVWIASGTASPDFPTTPNAFQPVYQGGESDGVIFCLNPTLSNLLYSTFYGGGGTDVLQGLTLMPNGNIAVCGLTTTSFQLPVTPAAYQAAYNGGITDGYAGILNPLTGALVASTYLGTGGEDEACKIQANTNNEIYILGRSDGAYPVSAGTYNIPDGKLFIHKFNSNLTASLASARTGFVTESCLPTAFLVDVCGTVYVSCIGVLGANTLPAQMPVTPNALVSTPRNYWCAALDGGLTDLKFATYFGSTNTGNGADHQHQGTAHFDPQGILYQSVCATLNNNPGTAGSWSPQKQNNGGNLDAFSFKIDFQLSGINADFSINPATNGGRDTGCAPLVLSFVNNSTATALYSWDFGDGSPLNNTASPTHTFQAGDYYVKLIATGNGQATQFCSGSDTAILHVVVLPGNKPLITLRDTLLCSNMPFNVTATVGNATAQTTYHWSPAAAILSNPNTSTVTIDPSVSTDIQVVVSNGPGACDTASETMHIAFSDITNAAIMPGDTFICPGDTILLTVSGEINTYTWNTTYNIAPDDATARVWPLESVVYSVNVADADNCQHELSAFVRILENYEIDAGKDKDVKYGESVRLNGSAPGDFFWKPDVFPSGTLQPEVRPLETTVYYLTGRASNGCIATDSVTVYVTFAHLPNAFSPNGDGLNDVFKLIPNNDRFKLLNFSIYNRWGNRIFYTEDVDDGWDGTYNDKPSDLGVYYYYVSYAIGEETYTFKGDLSLIR